MGKCQSPLKMPHRNVGVTDSADDKLVVFTEHRDTLTYLEGKISSTARIADEAVVVIHGGTGS